MAFGPELMDMTNPLDHHIAELLALHDCVIVPDFGGFVSNPVPARHDEALRTFHPPTKAISFNRNLTGNDGLLANRIASQEGIAYGAALHEVRESVLHYKAMLRDGQRVELARVGVLYQDQEANVHFVADRKANHLADAFGLNSVRIPAVTAADPVEVKTPVVALPAPTVAKQEEAPKPVAPVSKVEEKPAKVAAVAKPEAAAEKPKTKVVAITPDPKVVVLPETARKRRRWPIAAMAGVVLIGAFYSWHIPSNTDYKQTGEFQWGHLNPFSIGQQRAVASADYTPREKAFAVSEDQFAEVLAEQERMREEWEALRDANAAAEIETPVAVNEPTTNAIADASLPYHLIGGCFEFKENAEVRVEQLKSEGYPAYIYGLHNGLWAVSLGDYQSRDDANAAMNTARDNGRSSWVLKK